MMLLSAYKGLIEVADPEPVDPLAYAPRGIRLKLVSTVVTMKTIAEEVARSHYLKLDDLLGPSQERRIAWPRQRAFHACRQIVREDGTPRYSYPQIGRYFGERDHSTVIHGCRQHEKRLAEAMQ